MYEDRSKSSKPHSGIRFVSHLFVCVYMCACGHIEMNERDAINIRYSFFMLFIFVILFWPFEPAKNAIQKCHSNGSYERKSRGRKLADEMGRAKKIPMVHYRVMHWKRLTSELHDSYFRLMTIKHSISKIEWASNDYITQLSSTSQLNWVPVPVEFDAQGASGVASRVPVPVGDEMW